MFFSERERWGGAGEGGGGGVEFPSTISSTLSLVVDSTSGVPQRETSRGSNPMGGGRGTTRTQKEACWMGGRGNASRGGKEMLQERKKRCFWDETSPLVL